MGRSLTVRRRNEIAAELMREGTVKAAELSERYHVSTETIRKDIIYLEEQGLAQKSYGGAIAVRDLIEQPIAVKEVTNKEEKAEIALAAATLIPQNCTLLIDGGSTTYALASQLTTRDDLTVFTNSVNIMQLLGSSGNKVFGLGGVMRPSSLCMVGDWAVSQLKGLKVNLAFLGTDSFGTAQGPVSASYEEMQLKRTITERAERTYVLADYTKFGPANLFQVCAWENVEAVITNAKARNLYEPEWNRIKERTKILNCTEVLRENR